MSGDVSADAPPAVAEERGPFVIIRLNRPAQRNPLSATTLDALEVFATARRVTGAEALEMGLVNRLGEPVPELAVETAKALTSSQG